jgi:hypothetical protein
MQVGCGGEGRRIRMDILDRDMFDPHPATPERTSWTMTLLGWLDELLGSAVMDRPVFTLSEMSPPGRPRPRLPRFIDWGLHVPAVEYVAISARVDGVH